jgi:hypothetical protein
MCRESPPATAVIRASPTHSGVSRPKKTYRLPATRPIRHEYPRRVAPGSRPSSSAMTDPHFTRVVTATATIINGPSRYRLAINLQSGWSGETSACHVSDPTTGPGGRGYSAGSPSSLVGRPKSILSGGARADDPSSSSTPVNGSNDVNVEFLTTYDWHADIHDRWNDHRARGE